MINQDQINSYWEKEVCDTRFSNTPDGYKHYIEIKNARYRTEPYIKEFAFSNKYLSIAGMKILEIGVGSGADLIEFLKRDAVCFGIDSTEASVKEATRNTQIALTNDQLKNLKFLKQVNAEKLPFENDEFDIVYSHGVIHHAKNTMSCIAEAIRVLKPGGTLKLMVYSNFSATGFLLWILYGLAKLRVFLSQEQIISEHLESPGTKSYSKREFRKILEGFGLSNIVFNKYACAGDLMLMPPSEKYKKTSTSIFLFYLVKKFYPRRIVRKFQNVLGIALTATAIK